MSIKQWLTVQLRRMMPSTSRISENRSAFSEEKTLWTAPRIAKSAFYSENDARTIAHMRAKLQRGQ